MSQDKIDRKALKKPDTFVRRGRQALESLAQNRNPLLILLVLIVAAGFGYEAYKSWSSSRLAKGWTSYFEANELKGPERIAKMKEVYETSSGQRGSFMAAVTVADHYYDAAQRKVRSLRVKEVTGKEAKLADETKQDLEPTLTVQQAGAQAVEWYGKALGFSGLIPAERDLLNLNQGYAWEIQGNWDEALKAYQSVVDSGGQGKALAMVNAGRALEAKKEVAAAKTTYQTVATDFPNTEYARMAKNYLRRMDSPLLSEKL